MPHAGLSTLLIVVAALSGGVARLAAQDSSKAAQIPAQDTGVQGYAPTPAPARAAPAVPAPTSVMDAGITLLPPRGTDRIQADLELAKSDMRDADADKATASDRRSRGQAEIEVKKHEVSTLDAKLKLADKQKNESEKVALAADKKAAEQEREVLERRAELYKTEVDVADKRAAFARASQRALQQELELARRRDERSRLTTPGPEATHLDQMIVELERKVLEGQHDRAQAMAELGDTEKQLSDRRIAVLRVQTAGVQK